MARTYRRQQCRYKHSWVLTDWTWERGSVVRFRVDPRSTTGRRLLAYYHSDAFVSTASGPPRWYRRVDSRRVKYRDEQILQRWLRNPLFDPVLQVKHYRNARWTWW